MSSGNYKIHPILSVIRLAALNHEELKLFQNRLGELKNEVDEK